MIMFLVQHKSSKAIGGLFEWEWAAEDYIQKEYVEVYGPEVRDDFEIRRLAVNQGF